MQLVNQTPVPATLRVAAIPGAADRRGSLTAKATFRFRNGRAELDAGSPLEIFAGARPHGESLLPADVAVRDNDHFEVMLVGALEAPGGQPLRRGRVRLEVGGIARELEVIGDRRWQWTAGRWVATEPEPFTTMPLVWERAFGGTAKVAIDAGVEVVVSEPQNPHGRGFDPVARVEAAARELHLPRGFPTTASLRLLPNLEDPTALIVDPRDRPQPKCWAPMPHECALRMAHVIDRLSHDDGPGTPADRRELARSALRHAHPDWWIPRPCRGARLRIAGLLGDGDVELELPALRVLGDYVVGARRGVRELVPQSLLILAAERRFTIVYRAGFRVRYEPGTERCFRLRLEEGWYGEP